MSKRSVDQIGFIVDDMEKAMREYGAIYHIKHWFRAVNTPPGKIFYNGEEIQDPGFDACIGYCGRTEIELITTSHPDNLYGAFLREQGPGLHHFCFFVKDINKVIKEYEAQGFNVIQRGSMNGKHMVSYYAYLVKPGEKFSRIVELGETKLGPISLRRTPLRLWLGILTGDSKRLT